MSIDRNVGGMSEYLSRIRLAPQYNRAKKDVGSLLMSIPHIGDKAFRTARIVKDSVRSALIPGGIFEELGFHYIGPVDGHNIALMQDIFCRAKEMDGPILIHIHTKKGKGYLPAEKMPGKFHGIGCFDRKTGVCEKKAGAPTYTAVFSDALIRLAANHTNITAITAAMPTGTGLKAFGERYPDRFFDVGIAEEHAVTLAAGMAADGCHPVVALYSTFAQRAYDQILHDVCISKEGQTEGVDLPLKIYYKGEEQDIPHDEIYKECSISMPVDQKRNMMNASSNYRIISAIIDAIRTGNNQKVFSPADNS